ncbi:hypothetical protein Vi05172_g6134 [Venturia inaequalis]|nr:hypothetical protein Vi05172_g6134 [Venturia inaequalis]
MDQEYACRRPDESTPSVQIILVRAIICNLAVLIVNWGVIEIGGLHQPPYSSSLSNDTPEML